MVFRDDREALRARAERAEQKLAEAERELARARAAAEEPPPVAPASPSPSPSAPSTPRRWVRRVAILGALGAGIAGILFYLSTRMDREATASWHAVVRDGGGVVEPESPCTLNGHFRSNGVSRVVARVEVRCGNTVLYADDREFGGLFSFGGRHCGIWEGHADGAQPGVYHYRLSCVDPGDGTSTAPRNVLDLDTEVGRLIVTDASGHRVGLLVDVFSEARPGEPLYEGNTPSGSGAAFAAFERNGKVALTTRADQVHQGAPCVVRVEPTLGRRHNCRVVVRCDDHLLYGAKGNGYTDCEMVQGAPIRAHDKEGTVAEGDPILKMDLATGKVDVSDDLPGAAAVTIELDPGGGPSEPSPR